MDKKEMELALAELKSKLEEAITAKAKADIQAEIKALQSKLDEIKEAKDEAKAAKEAVAGVSAQVTAISDDIKVIKDAADKNQKALDKLLIEGKGGGAPLAKKSFGAAFAEAAEASYDTIQKGQAFTMEVKDVADMTMTNTVGGITEGIPTINPVPVTLPGQSMNFRQLVKTYPTATGLYWQYVESGAEGAIGKQVEGQAKPQRDYNFNKSVMTVDFVSGYARVSRQLLQDLPFIQNVLPQLLLRDFMIKENQLFYDALVALIPEATTTEPAVADQIIDTIAELEENNFSATGTVLRPTKYAQMYKYKGAGSGDYTMPGVVQLNANGSMSINGVPLLKANWLDPTIGIVGDWDYAKIIQASNLEVKFFEQDQDNVIKNMVTVRIEARQGLAIDLASAFRKFTIGA